MISLCFYQSWNTYFISASNQSKCAFHLPLQNVSNRLSYQERKNTLHAAQENALREKIHEHDIVRNAELRKFRREQLLQRQNLEKVLLTEVRRIKGTMWRFAHIEKLIVNFPSWSVVIRVNLLHVPLWFIIIFDVFDFFCR